MWATATTGKLTSAPRDRVTATARRTCMNARRTVCAYVTNGPISAFYRAKISTSPLASRLDAARRVEVRALGCHSRARPRRTTRGDLTLLPTTHAATGRLHGRGMLSLTRRRAWETSVKMFAGVSPCWAGAAASRGFPAAGTRSASRSASRVARATSWRRDATFGARALASFDGAGRDTPGDRVLGAPRRRIANRALSVPEGATEEEEGDDRGYASGGPKILRFNGDKISLHQSPANGSTNARRAAAAGASSLTPRIFQILLGNARAVPETRPVSPEGAFFFPNRKASSRVSPLTSSSLFDPSCLAENTPYAQASISTPRPSPRTTATA